ncbi:MAG: hypothetical protein JW820_05225 [Spirochaetales bacterium]|nr:hypothetical protein [Spirochaetales bacterium]
MKLRFFCEHCGAEVPRNTVRCPACGRYFTAIQCPQCGYRGRESDFASGCPRCGYMRPQEAAVEKGASKGGRVRREERGQGRQPRGVRAPAPARPGGSASEAREGPPPSVYRIMGLVLLVLLGVLIAVLFLL